MHDIHIYIYMLYAAVAHAMCKFHTKKIARYGPLTYVHTQFTLYWRIHMHIQVTRNVKQRQTAVQILIHAKKIFFSD